MSCKLAGEDLYKYFYDPNSSVLDDYTGASAVVSGHLGDFSATCSIPADGGGRGETVELPNQDFNIKIVVNDDGSYEVYAVDKKTGEKIETKKTKDLVGRIKDGINKAINELKGQKVDFNLAQALRDMAKFAATYYRGFDIRMTGGKNTWAGHFFYHATRGAVIAQYLVDEPLKEDPGGRYPADDFNQYNVEIGFWCSFYDKAMGFNMKFSDISDSHLGLVEFGNLIKSIIMQESNFQQFVNDKPKEHDFVNGKATRWGLIAVGVPETQGVNANILRRIFGSNATGIQEADIKELAFYNIGAGMGHLMGKLRVSGRNPTEEEWKSAVKAYNGSGKNADKYLNQVWERFEKYNEESYKKRNH